MPQSNAEMLINSVIWVNNRLDIIGHSDGLSISHHDSPGQCANNLMNMWESSVLLSSVDGNTKVMGSISRK